MTTPRIEEMATELVKDIFGVEFGGSEYDVAFNALTEAYQAGINGAMEIIKEELRNAPLEVQMTKGVFFGKVIKALQDNK